MEAYIKKIRVLNIEDKTTLAVKLTKKGLKHLAQYVDSKNKKIILNDSGEGYKKDGINFGHLQHQIPFQDGLLYFFGFDEEYTNINFETRLAKDCFLYEAKKIIKEAYSKFYYK